MNTAHVRSTLSNLSSEVLVKLKPNCKKPLFACVDCLCFQSNYQGSIVYYWWPFACGSVQ